MLKFVEKELLLSLVESYNSKNRSYSFKCKKKVLFKKTPKLQNEESKNRIYSGQIKVAKTKYQDVGQEKATTYKTYVVQPFLHHG
jgi:hypothetical protein